METEKQREEWNNIWRNRFNEIFIDLSEVKNISPFNLCIVIYLISNIRFLWNIRKRIFNFKEKLYDENECIALLDECDYNREFSTLINAVRFLSYRDRNIVMRVVEMMLLKL